MPTPQEAIVHIIDDEVTVRIALERLCRSAGLKAETFASVEEYLHTAKKDEPACLVSDVRMPGISGLELPAALAREGRDTPVIFVTAHDTPETRQLAREAGACAYFRKPVDDQALLDAIGWALSRQPAQPKTSPPRVPEHNPS